MFNKIATYNFNNADKVITFEQDIWINLND